MSRWIPFSPIALFRSGLRTRITRLHRHTVPSLQVALRYWGATKLWKAKAPGKVKFFFWLVLHRRLWTVERRKRHGLQDHDDSILCAQEPETRSHLFLGCVFAREIWFKLLHPTGMDSLLHNMTMKLRTGGFGK